MKAGRNVPFRDPSGQSFDDGRFAHARFPDQHRVVLRPAGQHLHQTANLLFPSDHRIQVPFASELGQVLRVLVQGLVLVLRVLTGHALPAPHIFQGLQHIVLRHSDTLQRRSRGVVLRERQQEMFRADVFVVHLRGATPCIFQAVGQLRRHSMFFDGAGQFRYLIQKLLHFSAVIRTGHADLIKDGRDEPFLLVNQSQRKVRGIDLAMVAFRRDLLGGL